MRHSERRKASLVPRSSCHQSPTNGSHWLNPAPSQLTQRAGKYCLRGWVPLQRRAYQGSQPNTGWCGLKSHNSFTLLSPTDGFQRGSYCFPDRWEVGFQPGLNLYLFHYETDHLFTWNTDLTRMYMDWGWEGGRGESQWSIPIICHKWSSQEHQSHRFPNWALRLWQWPKLASHLPRRDPAQELFQKNWKATKPQRN